MLFSYSYGEKLPSYAFLPCPGIFRRIVIVAFYFVGLQLDGGDVYQVVDDGIDGEARRGVDLELSCDVSPVCDDGVDGDAEVVGDFLIGHSLHHADDDILLAVAQCLRPRWRLVDHIGDFVRHVALFELLFQ